MAHEIESALSSSLAEDDPDLNGFKAWLWSRERRLRWDNVINWMAEPTVQSVHIARLLTFTGQMGPAHDHWDVSDAAANVLRAAVLQCGRGSLLEFAKAFEALGAPPSLFIRVWYRAQGARMTSGWPAECVWPFFANSPEALEAGFDPTSPYAKEPGFDRCRLLDALAALPELSAAALARVVELATTPCRRTRDAAARFLQGAPGAQEVAVQRLTASFKIEKNETARDLILTALESLGDPVERHLPKEDLSRAAVVELAKPAPAALAWFPFAQLPLVHWAGGEDAVSPEVIQWFVIQSHRLKNPQPGATMRRYCQMFLPADREALEVFALGAWMANDLTPGSSGVSSRGVLALVAACGGAHVSAMAHQYLKEWHGVRPAQCRALLQMLAATDHPASMQLLLSAAERFRVKSVREEAAKQSQHLAARKGWSAEELSDRTIPWWGLDETGALSVSCDGSRLTALLTESLEIELTGAGEPPTEAQKTELSAIRHELRTLLRLQRDRLYEAMCGGRLWPFEDWSLFLRAHPVLRFYCRRLVWGVMEDGQITDTFRPLADGALTSAAGAVIQPSIDALVTLTHDCNSEVSIGDAWREHFKTHELSPLFPQFGRGALYPAADQLDDISLDDREGVIIDTLKLRDAAAEYGYCRGPEESGGWCFSYVKRFPALALEAVVEFTGDQAPEHNRYVALRRLSLRSLAPVNAGAPTPLGEIPPILLSECWNDLHQIAASGAEPPTS